MITVRGEQVEQDLKIISCGCRFNRYESAEIRQQLESGHDKPLVVINSCAVTARSEAKSRNAVRRAVRENPNASIIVTGCWAELDPESVRNIEGVDLVLGNVEKLNPAPVLKSGAGVAVGLVNKVKKFTEVRAGLMEYRTAAYLKIQNGCDETCSFCVVRLARGRSRSASLPFVLERAKELQKEGAKELVLTGINLGQYGQDLSGNLSLPVLLNELATRSTARIRLSSINPTEVTDELLDVMASHHNICNYLHVPMQSGSTSILKAMRRPYTADDYRRTILNAFEKLPGIGLGCDILAGFPGETDLDHKQSLAMLEELPFSYAHVFSYSSRPGTDASRMTGEVPPPVKKERTEELKTIAEQKNQNFRKNLVGKQVQVLLEKRKDRLAVKGKSDTLVSTTVVNADAYKGMLVNALVTGLTEGGISAEFAGVVNPASKGD